MVFESRIRIGERALHMSVMDSLEKTISFLKKGSAAGIAIVNGVIGDRLDELQIPLATVMGFYRYGTFIKPAADVIKTAYPDMSSKACVLIHGLACDETIWGFPGDSYTDYGSLLGKDLGYTPFYLRYNTGLHVSENGKQLSGLMDQLYARYPIPMEEITFICHSMGGLVARSACHYAKKHKKRWVTKVKKIFFLGSPHGGSPLEKLGNLASGILRAIPNPVTRIITGVINLRSSGIKDLRYGYIVDEDWKGRNPDAVLVNTRTVVPPLKGARYYVITGTLTEDPNHIVSQWLGDALVRRKSSLGQTDKKNPSIMFSPEHHREFPGVAHLRLTHFHGIYEQILEWCRHQ